MKNCDRKDQTLHKIYDAVQELLVEIGNDMSIKDICKRAGIGVGTFYHYYTSKDEAIFDISNPIDVYFKQTVEPLLRDEAPSKQLQIYFIHQAQFMTDYVLVNGQASFLRAIQANLEHFFSENRLTFHLLKEIISADELYKDWKERYSPEMITWHLLHLARGLIHHWLGSSCNYILRDKLLANIEMTNPLGK